MNSKLFLLLSPSASLEGFFERMSVMGWSLALGDNELSQAVVGILPISKQINLDDCKARIEDVKRKKPDLKVVAVFSGKSKFKAFQFKEIGCEFVFQIPIEEDLFINRVCEWVPLDFAEEGLSFDHLLRVNMLSLKGKTEAPFDLYLYLPANKKVVRYIKEKDPIDVKVLEKFDKSKNFSLFIRRNQIQKYRQFTQEVLKNKTSASSQLAVTEKVTSLKEDFQHLMSPFFSEAELTDEEAQQTSTQINEILKEIETTTSISKNTKVQLETLAFQKMTNATHGQNVAAYCALFGLALGRTDLEDLRLGGLLHDIGLSDLPVDVLFKGEAALEGEDKSRYRLHPGNGQMEVKNRKIPVNETVMNMILLHHERASGKGYPYGKKGPEIPQEAHICALADEFDKLTSLRDGYRCYGAQEAMLLISGELTGTPLEVYYEPVHKPIVDFYLQRANPAKPLAKPPPAPAGFSGVQTRSAIDNYVGKTWQKPITLGEVAKTLGPEAPPLEMDEKLAVEFQSYAQELEFYFLTEPKILR